MDLELRDEDLGLENTRVIYVGQYVSCLDMGTNPVLEPWCLNDARNWTRDFEGCDLLKNGP